MRERRRRRRVGEIVGGHVDRLHRRDRALLGGGDALLQLTHFGGERRLVADRRRHAAEQRRYLGPGLREPEDVVDEHQHVLALDVAEVLGDGEAGETDPQARARRLVHLAVDQRAGLEDAALLHLQIEIVPLAGALAHATEHRPPPVAHGDVVNQLLDDDGLAHARAAEQTDLAALHERGDQVDHLDPRFEHLGLGLQVDELRRLAVDGPPLRRGRNRLAFVDRLAQYVQDPPQRRFADGHRDRLAGIDDLHAAHHAVGRAHRDGAHLVTPDVLLHLRGQADRGRAVAGMIDHHRVVELGEVLRLELHVEHGPDHLDDLSDIRCARRLLCLVLLLVRHRSPGSRGLGVRDSGLGSFRVPSPEPPVPSLSMLPPHPRSPPTPA